MKKDKSPFSKRLNGYTAKRLACASALLATGLTLAASAEPDAAALWAQLESTPKGREMLHGSCTTTRHQTVDEENLISISTATNIYADGFVFVSSTTNSLRPRVNTATVAPPNTPARYQEILKLREAAGWYAKPPEERPPQVKVYSVMRCVMAAKRLGVWDSKIKPYLAEAGLLDLIYTAQDFRSDDPNFTAAISALEKLDIPRETIDAALKEAEVAK